MPHAALWVVQLDSEPYRAALLSFNAARGFVGGAAYFRLSLEDRAWCFNAARGFVGGAARTPTS